MLAVSSPGPFSFLVAFEFPGSSECIGSHLSFLPYVQESWPLPAAMQAFKAHSLNSFKVAFQGPSAWRNKALEVAEHTVVQNGFQAWEKLRALLGKPSSTGIFGWLLLQRCDTG